jgi:hypothetical protein
VAGVQDIEHTVGEDDGLRQGFDAGCCIQSRGYFV